MPTVELSTPDGMMPGYVAEPVGERRGGVVVVQEAFGITSYLEEVAGRFADAGYLAIVPALFHRTGSPVLAYDDREGARREMAGLTAAGVSDDVDAALAHLEGRGVSPGHTAVVGFCMGGSVAMLAAAEHALGAAVTFYGGGLLEGRFGMPPLVELGPRLQTPWLGLYGDQDTSIPVDDVLELLDAAEHSAVPTAVVRYPEAGHGFHCDARPAAYDEPAAADAWHRTLTWLGDHLLA